LTALPEKNVKILHTCVQAIGWKTETAGVSANWKKDIYLKREI
jgi:hypothetical protein